ncbi:hypothetical protein D3C80_1196480 [compost metagenome]
MFVVPHLGFARHAAFDTQPERLPLALAGVVPARAEAEQAVRAPCAVGHPGGVVDPALVDRVEAEQPVAGQCAVRGGDAGLQPVESAAVMDRVEEAGDQILRLGRREGAHVLAGEVRLRATQGGAVQHRLVDVEATARIAGVDEVADMRPGSTGQIEMPAPAIAEQLLQPVSAVALRRVVDVGAHQVVIAGQVVVEGIAGHEGLMFQTGRAS